MRKANILLGGCLRIEMLLLPLFMVFLSLVCPFSVKAKTISVADGKMIIKRCLNERIVKKDIASILDNHLWVEGRYQGLTNIANSDEYGQYISFFDSNTTLKTWGYGDLEWDSGLSAWSAYSPVFYMIYRNGNVDDEYASYVVPDAGPDASIGNETWYVQSPSAPGEYTVACLYYAYADVGYGWQVVPDASTGEELIDAKFVDIEVKAPKPKSTNAWLKSLKPTVGKFNKKFAKTRLSYTLKLKKSKKAVVIKAVKADSKATLQFKIGGKWKTVTKQKVKLKVGKSKTVTIRVIAQDGKTKRTYRVKVTRAKK